MKIEVQLNHYDLRVLIDSLPHVYILRKDFVGYQGWADDNTMFIVEYYTTHNKIRTEFDSKQKWEEILKALNEKL
jgi:CRISPR/Cas system Type II protein with McrA/HNH and RuvC-like nuclease domain